MSSAIIYSYSKIQTVELHNKKQCLVFFTDGEPEQHRNGVMEYPCSKPQGYSTVRIFSYFLIRSLTPQPRWTGFPIRYNKLRGLHSLWQFSPRSKKLRLSRGRAGSAAG